MAVQQGQQGAAAEVLNRLFKRCVECPPTQPTCPACASDQTCSLVPQSCNACASMICIQMKGAGSSPESSTSSTPIGGIVGGVIGGVVAIIALTFAFWWFCIRNKRKRRQDLWEPPEKTTLGRSGTMLSRTHSIASTVMTRASNVIQIAYIPGVTVRSPTESPEIAPPMPSIPSTYAGTSAQTSPDVEQHFFMPRDLRDSVWSDTSSVMTDQRVSIAPSLARTTIYHDDATVPAIPAQYAFRAQANAVSVRSGSSTPSLRQNSTSAHPMPEMPKTINIQNSSIVARNVVARPIEVKKSNSGSNVPTLANLAKKSPSRRPTPVPVISDEKEVVMASPVSTTFSESPLLPVDGGRGAQSSFMSTGDVSASGISAVLPAEGPLGSNSAPNGRPTTAYTKAMIHEAMFRATQDTSHSSLQRPALRKQDSGPFSDANEIKDHAPR